MNCDVFIAGFIFVQVTNANAKYILKKTYQMHLFYSSHGILDALFVVNFKGCHLLITGAVNSYLAYSIV